jgi:3-dehydroquinate synthase
VGGWIVERAVDGMLSELEPNVYENRGYRRPVDLGHTFSPTLEAARGFTLSHGVAVAIDIALSAAVAVELGILPPETHERLVATLVACGLPVWSDDLSLELCYTALADTARHRGGDVNLVVPTAIGATTIVENAETVAGVLAGALRRASTARAA